MNTTNLFVELIVIGLGAAMWITLMILTVFGYEWIPAYDFLSIITAIPVLAIVYVLGIVSDRMIDKLFDCFWGTTFCKRHFGTVMEYHHARRNVLTSSDRLANLIGYSRSRLRICRGWAVHSILIAVTVPFFAWSALPNDHELAIKISIFCSGTFIFLGVTSWNAWRMLSETQYNQIKEGANFFETNSGK